jgi:hypothetical protein
MIDSSNAAPPLSLAVQLQPYALAVLTFTVSTVGAWFAGKWSIKREAEKLASQHAFELRLEWYKSVITALGEFQNTFLEFANAVREDAPEKEVLSLRNKGYDGLKSLHAETRQALLFGSPGTLRALTDMTVRLDHLGSNSDTVDVGKVEATIKRELAHAYLSLALDMREHLGLEGLRPQDIQASFFQ